MTSLPPTHLAFWFNFYIRELEKLFGCNFTDTKHWLRGEAMQSKSTNYNLVSRKLPGLYFNWSELFSPCYYICIVIVHIREVH